MFKNSMPKSAFVVLALATVAMSACTKKQAQPSDLKVDSVRITKVKTDSTQLGVKKVLTYKACLSRNDEALRNQTVAINDGFESREARTDKNGCVNWNEKHLVSADIGTNSNSASNSNSGSPSNSITSADPNPPSVSPMNSLNNENIIVSRTFSTIGTNPGSIARPSTFSTTIGLNINPTVEMPRDISIARISNPLDTTPLSFDSEAQLLNQVKKVGNAWAPWISLTFQGHAKTRTSVNRLLTIKPAQKFMLRMDPRLMMTDEKGEVTLEAIKFAEFKLTILTFTESNFASQNFSADNLITEYTGVLKARHDGNVLADINMRVHDVAGILSRSMAVVILEPMGTAAQTAGVGIFYAPVSPLRANNVYLELREFENAPKDLLARLEVSRQRANKSLTGLQMLQAAGFQQVNLPEAFVNNRLAGRAMTRAEHKLLSQVCAQMTPESLTLEPVELLPRLMNRKVSARSECVRQWSRVVRTEIRDLVENVRGVTHLPELANTKYLNLTRDLNHLVISRRELNQNVNVGIYGEFGVNAAAPKAGPFSASAGAKVSAGTNLHMMRARTKEKITNLQVHEGQHFQVYVDGYQLDLELRRCFIVQPNTEGQRGAFACSKTAHRKKVQEKYYLVNHGRDGSPFTDNDSPDTTEWRLVVRGEESYTNFEKMMTADNVMFDLQKFVLSFKGADLKRPLLPDMRVTQEFPGSLKITQK